MSKALITLFSAPKPFVDTHISIIQENALRSWKNLAPDVEILLMGAEEGLADAASRLGIQYFPGVACNQLGTPLISSMLEIAHRESQAPVLGIINTDIIVFRTLLEAVRLSRQRFDRFVLIGQRWDMEITDHLGDFQEVHDSLMEKMYAHAVLHPPMGSDYFLFPRACYRSIPDFAIGRAGWDNWFIFKSRFEGWNLIDATADNPIIHQNHDYRHLPGGQPHYRLPETRQNVIEAGGEYTIYSIFDAQYQMADHTIVKKQITWKKMLREVEIFPITKLRSQILGKIFYWFIHPRKAYFTFRKWLDGQSG